MARVRIITRAWRCGALDVLFNYDELLIEAIRTQRAYLNKYKGS
jgi:hypothetical protein